MNGKIKLLGITALATLMIGCSAIKLSENSKIDISDISPTITRTRDFGDGPEQFEI